MIAVITGSSGHIGRALVPRLESNGWTVRRMVRAAPGTDDILWNPATGLIDRDSLEGADAVIHLAGEPILGERWTPAKKRRITESRAGATRLLCEALAGLKRPPACLLSASGIGYYGSCDDKVLDESSLAGDGFLARVCSDWEAATAPAEAAGIRVAQLRIGVVLDPRDGALRQMLPAFRLGLGGPLGTGRQYVSWLTTDDLLRAIEHLLATPSVRGPCNLCTPQPVTSEDLARTLGRVLRRPAFCRVPSPLLRLLFGEVADEALLSSCRPMPEKLGNSGFAFQWSDLDAALRHLLTDGRAAQTASQTR